MQLAKLLKPEWGVDLIISGHSHTILDKPMKVGNILITQAGVGSDRVGRYDIVADDDTNSIVDYEWKLIQIGDNIADPDQKLVDYIQSTAEIVDRKYNTIISKFSKILTRSVREEETPLGNLIADCLARVDECDVVLVGSGSIRVKELGPLGLP